LAEVVKKCDRNGTKRRKKAPFMFSIIFLARSGKHIKVDCRGEAVYQKVLHRH